MKNSLRFTPLLSAALGAAAGFYIFNFAASSAQFPVWLLVVMLLLTAALCFFRVIASLPQNMLVQAVTCTEPAEQKFYSGLHRTFQLTAICSTALAVGFSFGFSAANAGRNVIRFAIAQERIIAIEGVLLEDPRIIGDGMAMAAVSLRRCAAEGGLRASAEGRITIFIPEENALRLRDFGRGAVIFSEGHLRETRMGLTFSGDSLHVIEAAPALERMRTRARLNLISRFEKKDLYGTGGLSLALLLGIRDNLDSNLAVLYRQAGVSYILALSGMHLAVLAAIISFCLKPALGLKAAAIVGAILVCLYCFLVGPMPSLNRAAFMYLLGVFAVVGMLPKEPLSLLALSFLLQIAFTPAAGNSISFILSYLALTGILVIGRPLYFLIAGKLPDFLLQPLAASCGAFLGTAGIISFFFGTLAPIGIVLGLLLVPLTTIFMIGSILWLVLDFVSLSGLLALPLNLLYGLMESIVSLGSRAPNISAVNPAAILVFTVVVFLGVIVLEQRYRKGMLALKAF